MKKQHSKLNEQVHSKAAHQSEQDLADALNNQLIRMQKEESENEMDNIDFSDYNQVRKAFIASEIFNRKY